MLRVTIAKCGLAASALARSQSIASGAPVGLRLVCSSFTPPHSGGSDAFAHTAITRVSVVVADGLVPAPSHSSFPSLSVAPSAAVKSPMSSVCSSVVVPIEVKFDSVAVPPKALLAVASERFGVPSLLEGEAEPRVVEGKAADDSAAALHLRPFVLSRMALAEALALSEEGNPIARYGITSLLSQSTEEWWRLATHAMITASYPQRRCSIAHEATVAVAAVLSTVPVEGCGTPPAHPRGIASPATPPSSDRRCPTARIGVDVVDVERLASLLRRQPRFVARWLPHLISSPRLIHSRRHDVPSEEGNDCSSCSNNNIGRIAEQWGLRECMAKLFGENKAVLMRDCTLVDDYDGPAVTSADGFDRGALDEEAYRHHGLIGAPNGPPLQWRGARFVGLTADRFAPLGLQPAVRYAAFDAGRGHVGVVAVADCAV